jgi:hypothetical protein
VPIAKTANVPEQLALTHEKAPSRHLIYRRTAELSGVSSNDHLYHRNQRQHQPVNDEFF